MTERSSAVDAGHDEASSRDGGVPEHGVSAYRDRSNRSNAIAVKRPRAGSESADGAAFASLGLQVQLDRAGRQITVRGELDCAGARVLTDVMDKLIGLGPGDSVIDLAGVSFIDAGGLGVVVSLANQLADLGAKLTVANARPPVRRVFDMVGLAGMLEGAT